MSFEIECPYCEAIVEDDPELCDGKIEEFHVECPSCKGEILYDIQYDPMECNIRKTPKCYRSKCEPKDKEHSLYIDKICIHCKKLIVRNWKLETL